MKSFLALAWRLLLATAILSCLKIWNPLRAATLGSGRMLSMALPVGPDAGGVCHHAEAAARLVVCRSPLDVPPGALPSELPEVKGRIVFLYSPEAGLTATSPTWGFEERLPGSFGPPLVVVGVAGKPSDSASAAKRAGTGLANGIRTGAVVREANGDPPDTFLPAVWFFSLQVPNGGQACHLLASAAPEEAVPAELICVANRGVSGAAEGAWLRARFGGLRAEKPALTADPFRGAFTRAAVVSEGRARGGRHEGDGSALWHIMLTGFILTAFGALRRVPAKGAFAGESILPGVRRHLNSVWKGRIGLGCFRRAKLKEAIPGAPDAMPALDASARAGLTLPVRGKQCPRLLERTKKQKAAAASVSQVA